MGADNSDVRSAPEEISCGIGEIHDRCEGSSEDVRRGVVDLEYFDEQTWKKVDPVGSLRVYPPRRSAAGSSGEGGQGQVGGDKQGHRSGSSADLALART